MYMYAWYISSYLFICFYRNDCGIKNLKWQQSNKCRGTRAYAASTATRIGAKRLDNVTLTYIF